MLRLKGSDRMKVAGAAGKAEGLGHLWPITASAKIPAGLAQIFLQLIPCRAAGGRPPELQWESARDWRM